MKIKELLELTQKESLHEISKNRLAISRGAAREALKAAGCHAISGKRGWFYNGSNPEILELSVYQFARIKKAKALLGEFEKSENSHLEKTEESQTELINKTIKISTLEPINQQTKETIRKRASYDLDVALQKKLKLYCVQQDKNLYEVVEAALQEYLEKYN